MSAIVTARDIHAHVIYIYLSLHPVSTAASCTFHGEEAFGYYTITLPMSAVLVRIRRFESIPRTILRADKSSYPAVSSPFPSERGDDKNYERVYPPPRALWDSRDFR